MIKKRHFVIAFLGLVSCRACDSVPQPGQECFAESLVPDTVPDSGKAACVACMEKTPCCDVVGACKDDPTCTNRFREIHSCVLASGGPRGQLEEPRCVGAGEVASGSQDVYRCMRTNCGRECALPVCTLEPLVPFAATPRCDSCFAIKCCEEFNECARHRECRLALECIVTECKNELVSILDKREAEQTAEQEAFFCGRTTTPPAEEDDSGPPLESCSDRCVLRYLGDFDSPLTAELSRARCLALRVRNCGAQNDCGPACVIPDAGDTD